MQSDMYPLCPYHDAWKPGIPLGTRAGGAIPGPTLLAHVAARDAYDGMSAATSANMNRRLRTLPTTRLTRRRGMRDREEVLRYEPHLFGSGHPVEIVESRQIHRPRERPQRSLAP